MDHRFNRPSSPGSRRLAQPFRSSTGTLMYPASYDPYYAPARSSSEFVSGPRTSAERVTGPRIIRTQKDQHAALRQAHDDYHIPPRRTTLELPPSSTARKPLTVVATGSPNRYRPVISSAAEKPSTTLTKFRIRDDEPYLVQPASSSSRREHQRNYSADSRDIDRLMTTGSKDRDRGERGGYRSSGLGSGRTTYNLDRPLVKVPQENDRDYGYEYTDRKEQMYRDTAPRPRQRRESLSARPERPISMSELDHYLPKVTSANRDGPPVTTRGFGKIDRTESLRRDYQDREPNPRDSVSSRNRDDTDSLQRRRSTRAPVVLQQDPDDGYSSYREDRSDPHRRRRHKSRRDESVDRDNDDRGLGIRLPREDDSRREQEEKPRRHHESGHRRDRDDLEDRDRRPRDDHHGDKQGKLGEELALGAAGVAAAGLVAEGFKHRRDRDPDRDTPERDANVPRERKRDPDRDRQVSVQLPSESSGPIMSNSDEEQKERRRRRRREKEARAEEEAVRGRVAEPGRQEDDAFRPGSYERDARPPPETAREGDEPRRRHRHRKHRERTKDEDSNDEDSSDELGRAPREPRQSVVRVVSPSREKEPEPKPKGILRQPREKFPEDPAPIREGVAPLKDAGKKGVPPNARWTKIDRKLVNPEALDQGNERYEERVDYVIVLRVLTKEEIEQYATRTQEIREARDEKFLDDRRRLKAIEDAERKYERAPIAIDNRPYEEPKPHAPSIQPSHDPQRPNQVSMALSYDRPNPQSQAPLQPSHDPQRPSQISMGPSYDRPNPQQQFPPQPSYDPQRPNQVSMGPSYDRSNPPHQPPAQSQYDAQRSHHYATPPPPPVQPLQPPIQPMYDPRMDNRQDLPPPPPPKPQPYVSPESGLMEDPQRPGMYMGYQRNPPVPGQGQPGRGEY